MVMCATSLHGHRVARPELGEAVVVTGMGIVGQLAATFAGLSGAVPVIGVDLDEFRLQKARDRGVDVCINPGRESDVAGAVRRHCVADGVDLVIEATGVPSVYPMALTLPRLGGPTARPRFPAWLGGSELFRRGPSARGHGPGRPPAQNTR